jgi:membrane protein YqaA with SNARE-associated domain
MHKLAHWLQVVVVPALGPLGVFLVTLLDGVVGIPPIPELVVAASGMGPTGVMWSAVIAATLGSTLGCSAIWLVGKRGGERLMIRRFGAEPVARARAALLRWDIAALAIPAISPPPVPVKLFLLAAGVFGLPFRRFVVTVGVARGVRFGACALLGRLYGQRALDGLDALGPWFASKKSILLGAGAVLCVVVVLVLARRRRRALERVESGDGVRSDIIASGLSCEATEGD